MIILRLVGYPQGRILARGGRAALFTRLSLEPGTPLRVWVEEEAAWVDAVVVEKLRPSMEKLEGLVENAGFETVDEWLRWEEKRNGGSLPPWVIIVEPRA